MSVMKRFWLRKILKPLGYNIIQYDYRPFDRFMKSLNKSDLIGTEIGVYDGWHALEMMENLSIKKLSLVDPYLSYAEYYESVQNPRKSQNGMNERMKVAHKVMKKYGDKTEFIRKFSEEAAKLILDESLDFVYIDGNHQYEFVKKDIEAWYPKVKKGGIIGGDDYTSCPETEMEKFGIFKAVHEFFNKSKKKVSFYNTDWWVIK
jgi:hypothetical protein